MLPFFMSDVTRRDSEHVTTGFNSHRVKEREFADDRGWWELISDQRTQWFGALNARQRVIRLQHVRSTELVSTFVGL